MIAILSEIARARKIGAVGEDGLTTSGLHSHSRIRLAPVAKTALFARMLLSRRTIVLFCLAAFAALTAPASAAQRSAPTRPTAKSSDDASAYKGAIVVDAATGHVLFEDRADFEGPPASMTKLMTFAVLADQLAAGKITLTTAIRIMPEDNIGGTQVFLDPRETFPVEELIYAMMIQSANDAARTLARASAGSVEAFVELMNAKARQLGMTNTLFRTPHGLPPSNRKVAEGDLSTPRDYALLCRHLLLKTDILKYTTVRTRPFGAERAQGPMRMDNHNKLLGKVDGVDGLKTGFTNSAGYCTSVTAQRNGRRIIVVIMGSLGPGGQHDLGKTRDLKAVDLIGRGFAALPAESPAFRPAPAPNTSDSPIASGSPASAAPANATAATPAKPAATASTATKSDAAIKFSLPPPKKK